MTAENGAALRREIESAARSIAGDAWADEVVAAWDAHAAKTEPVVTIFGPVNAGKSTLLKRLLVEEAAPVPAWLTVGVPPTSFEVNEVASSGLVYRDTPGIGSGSESHDAAANQAVVLTDALFVVVPPTFGGEKQRIVELVDGSFYGPSPAATFPPGALALVVTLLDSAGADPVADREEYEELRARKRGELEKMLRRTGSPPPVHLVAADPFARVAGAPQPRPEDYESGDWDGIGELRAALRALGSRRAELRAAAGTRYWSWIGGQVLQRAGQELRRLDEAVGELDRRHRAMSNLEHDLDVVDAAARAAIESAVRSELLEMVDSEFADTEARLRAHAERRLRETVTAWIRRWGAEFERLASSVEEEMGLRVERPAAAALPDFDPPVRPGQSAKERVPSARSVSDLLQTLKPQILWTIRQRTERRLTMPIDEARDVLKNLRLHPGKVTLERDRIDKITKGVRGHDRWEQLVVPTLIQAGPLLWDAVARQVGRIIDEQERRRRRELAEKAAGAVLEGILGSGGNEDGLGWNPAVAGLRAVLRDTRPQEAAVTAYGKQAADLRRSVSSLTRLLQSGPVRVAEAGS
jgi:hypothetical protein